MGQSPEGEACNTSGNGMPLLNGPTEFGGHHPTPVQYTSDARKLAAKGDILFCVRGSTTGKMNWADRPYAIGRGLAAIRPKHGLDTAHYVRAIIEAGLSQLLQAATGSTFPNVSREQLLGMPCHVLGVSEQKRIAGILGALDDKIELNRKMNETLEQMARALFKSWFIDFEPVRTKATGNQPAGMDKDTAVLFPNNFVDSELGKIPEGWSLKTAEEISTVGIGKTPPRKEKHWFTEDKMDVPWMSIRDLGSSGTFISSTSEFLTNKAVERFRIKRIPDNTVVLSFKLTVGRVAITSGEMLSNEAIAHFSLNKDSSIGTSYLYCYLKNFSYDQLGSTSSIATAVNSETVRGIPILIPTKAICNAFEKTVEHIFSLIKKNQEQCATLSALRDTLLPKLLSGDITDFKK